MHGTASPTHVGKPYHVTRVPSKPMLLLMRLLSQVSALTLTLTLTLTLSLTDASPDAPHPPGEGEG